MTDVQRLIDIEAIRQLKAKRLRAIDAKDWPLYQSLHTTDHVSDTYGGEQQVGAAENCAHLKALLDGVTTIHHVHIYEIEFADADNASGIWAMEDWLHWTQDGAAHWLHGWGHYHERYRRENTEWRFCYRRLDRIRVEKSEGADLALRDKL